jgi:hypothetical protein
MQLERSTRSAGGPVRRRRIACLHHRRTVRVAGLHRGREANERSERINVLAIFGSLRAGSYNRAALRTAIDWASRPLDQPFAGKPVAMMGAGAGKAGTARAQYDLRRCCVFLDMHPINKPEVLIGQVQTEFDAEGSLTDEARAGSFAICSSHSSSGPGSSDARADRLEA